MRDPQRPIVIAILAFPEVTASTVFGMYDMFMSAGRDWGYIVEGRPGPQLMRPLVVSESGAPFTAANDVHIAPNCALTNCPAPDVVCVPELFVPPGEPLEGRFLVEIDWLKGCHAAGATLATACSGALLLAEAGLLNGYQATTHWAYCDIMARRYPGVQVLGQRALV